MYMLVKGGLLATLQWNRNPSGVELATQLGGLIVCGQEFELAGLGSLHLDVLLGLMSTASWD